MNNIIPSNNSLTFDWNGTRQQYQLPIKTIGEAFQQNFINITNESYYPQPLTLNSPNSTYVVAGKIYSDQNITILARNLIVTGEIKTSKKLTIQLDDMLMLTGSGKISGKEENITCKKKITDDSIRYY